MESIPHRELRNNSSAVLARVRAGESIAVTNNGDISAVLVPPPTGGLDRARMSGATRPARTSSPGFSAIHRVRADMTSAEIVADLRRDS